MRSLYAALFMMAFTLTVANPTNAELRASQEGEIIDGIVSRVLDGDGLMIDGTKVRLFGIDAFENDRPRGPEARKFLKKLVEGKHVRCTVKSYDKKNQRPNAICIDDAGKDLSCAVAWHGFAVEWRTKSGGRYSRCDRITRLQETPPPGLAPF